jgi:hypothetical protein
MRLSWPQYAEARLRHNRSGGALGLAAGSLDSRERFAEGAIMADEDDLPPQPAEQDDESTLGGSIGELFGASMWIVLFLVVGGGLAYLAIRLMH